MIPFVIYWDIPYVSFPVLPIALHDVVLCVHNNVGNHSN
jgi:hypothetical protein